jgi:ribose transport system ATP-binding protein
VPDPGEPAAISIRSLTKTFPGQAALADVDLDVRFGEVHALVGENGSGKSTLIKCLSGYHQPDAGSQMSVGGSPLPHGGGARGALAFVHQDIGIVGTMTVAENIALGRGYVTRHGVHIRWKSQAEVARRALARLGRGDISPGALASSLSPAAQSIVAVARALDSLGGARGAIVLDEPTASLPEADVAMLFAALREVAAQGVGVLFVSHRLGEVFAVADRVTVLREGRVVGTFAVAGLDERRLAELMLGRTFGDLYPQAPGESGDDVALRVAALSGPRVRDVSFSLHRGEIVGVTGLLGSGRSELLRLIFGSQPATSGSVQVAGVPFARRDPARAIGVGLAYVPPDRLASALLAQMTVTENVTLCTVPRFGRLRLRLGDEARHVDSVISQFDIKPPLNSRLAGHFSGGNQQKMILARALATNPRVLLLDEPTQGVDIGAKAEIHRIIERQAAEQGTAILIVSSELEDLVGLCHRVIVLRHGRRVAELRRPAMTVDDILSRAYTEEDVA